MRELRALQLYAGEIGGLGEYRRARRATRTAREHGERDSRDNGHSQVYVEVSYWHVDWSTGRLTVIDRAFSVIWL